MSISLERAFSRERPAQGIAWLSWIRGKVRLGGSFQLPVEASTGGVPVLRRDFCMALSIRLRAAPVFAGDAPLLEELFLAGTVPPPTGSRPLGRRFQAPGQGLECSSTYMDCGGPAAERLSFAWRRGAALFDERFELVPGASRSGLHEFRSVRFRLFGGRGEPDPGGWKVLLDLVQP